MVKSGPLVGWLGGRWLDKLDIRLNSVQLGRNFTELGNNSSFVKKTTGLIQYNSEEIHICKPLFADTPNLVTREGTKIFTIEKGNKFCFSHLF